MSFLTDRNRLGSRGSTTASSKATTELRLEFARSTALAFLASVAAPVALTVTATATAVSTITATAAWTALTIVTTEHAARGSVRTLLLDVRLGHDLGRQMEPLAEVVETLRCQGIVVVLP
jgi:hypothetical protein